MKHDWSAYGMVAALQLISCSINNVVSCLKIMNGVSPKDAKFTRPEDRAAFEEPWRESMGVTHMTLDRAMPDEYVKLLSKQELLEMYDRSSSK